MFAANKAVQSFYVMGEVDIGFDILTTLLHGFFSIFLLFARLLKTFTNAFSHGFRQDIDQLIHRSTFQSLVGQGHRWVDRCTWFQTGIGCAFTGTMNTNERLEKVHISQFLSLGTLGTNRQSHV